MKFKTAILDEAAVRRALSRISYEIIERSDLGRVLLVGIKTRGVPLAEIIKTNIAGITGTALPVCELDITHFRDDVAEKVEVKGEGLAVCPEGRDVILVDDVLFTGRTTRAAIEAVLSSGRARTIRLAVLVDRGHRELPIRADFVGKNVPTSMKEEVVVSIAPVDGETSVSIYEK